VEGFYYKYKNLQLQSVVIIPGGGTTTRITNAASATLKGFDLDITWKPVDRLTFNLGIEGMDGKYDDFPNGQFFYYNPVVGGNCAISVGGSTAACAGFATVKPPNYVPDPTNPATVVGTWNLSGNKTIQTPPFSANLTGTYTVPFTSGSLDLSLNYYHTGNYYADPDNGLGQIAPSSQANDHQALIDIVNASVTWNAKDDKWSLRLWGKNLGGEKYWSFANETGTVIKNVPAPPRTYGVNFTAHF
jgi:iron complex outermembrane receptor protein